MSATAAFGAELDALGIWWPRGDGDALRNAANAWETIAEFIDDSTAALDLAAIRLLDDYSGSSADAFASHWARWADDPGYLGDTASDCRRLCRALVDFASDIDAADRTLLQLIELALNAATAQSSGGAASLLDLDEVWRQWLFDAASAVGSGLATAADRVSAITRSVDTALSALGPAGDDSTGPVPTGVPDDSTDLPIFGDDTTGTPATTGTTGTGGGSSGDDIDLALVDPDAVDWVDPGDPDDLGHLSTTIIDFGAGQGSIPVLPSIPVPAAPLPPDEPGQLPWPGYPTAPWPGYPTAPMPGSPTGPWPIDPTTGLPTVGGLPPTPDDGGDGDVTITINGDGAVVTVGDTNQVSVDAPEPGGVGGGPIAPIRAPSDPFAPQPIDVDDLAPVDVAPIGGAGGGGAGGGGFSGGGFGGGGFGGGGSIDLTPIDGPETDYPPFGVDELTDTSLGNTLETPVADSFVTVPPPEAAAPAAASSGRGRMPFFPMMPMGMGGASGDDGQEPRRKRMRP